MRKYGNNRGNKSEARDIHAEITAKIITQLENGVAPWVKPWTTSARHSAMPRNAITKREYSGINPLLLWIEQQTKGYTSSEWLTFRQAKERGGSVRAGEHGVQVIYYKKLHYSETTDAGETITKTPLLARGYTVFNVEQCDGLKLKGEPELPPAVVTADGLDAAYMAAVKATGADLRHGGGRAFYRPSADFVQMPPVETFKSAAGYQSTLAHELVHWTGHKSRLDRFEGRDDERAVAYAFEELIAEIGASFTVAQFGLVPEIEQNAAYIGHWIKLLKDDKKVIFRAASRASRAVAFLYPSKQNEEEESEGERAIAA